MGMAGEINDTGMLCKYDIELRIAPGGASVNRTPRVRMLEYENRL